jgi:hypothetical protein
MLLINNKEDPNLVGILEDNRELDVIAQWVNNLNKDLRDSGFEEHQAKVELIDNRAYITPIEGAS